jgi:hypothetical protein
MPAHHIALHSRRPVTGVAAFSHRPRLSFAAIHVRGRPRQRVYENGRVFRGTGVNNHVLALGAASSMKRQIRRVRSQSNRVGVHGLT